MVQAALVATLNAPPSADGKELRTLPAAVEWLEVRADVLGDINPQWLRAHFKGQLLYTLRSRAHEGEFAGSNDEREARLRAATGHYDLVELESGRDLGGRVTDEIPAAKRLLAWHDAPADVRRLEREFARLSATPARFYKLTTRAARSGDELAALLLLEGLKRADTIAYAAGAIGFWSRVLAAHLGSPFLYGALDTQDSIACEPTVARLIEDYGLPASTPPRALYGIVGNPVFHSLSPRLHNAAYRAMNYPALFLPFHVESFGEFWRGIVENEEFASLGIPIRGLTVASPHKEAALASKACSPMAEHAGSTNIVVRDGDSWRAETTDPEGVMLSAQARGLRIKNRGAAVVGCGGAGRAIASALSRAGARVTLVNRGLERGQLAAQLLDLPFVPLSQFSVRDFSLVVNATPVGRNDGELPFAVAELSSDALVVDLVYGARPTPLVAHARARGCEVIDGREVLLTQVQRQFNLMIGSEMPHGLVSEVLGRKAAPVVASSSSYAPDAELEPSQLLPAIT